MRRGAQYWLWADPSLHHRCHIEVLDDGTRIDVQARLSRTGETQLFIGVYSHKESLILEEAYFSRPQETMGRALSWGVDRARSFVVDATPLKSIHVL